VLAASIATTASSCTGSMRFVSGSGMCVLAVGFLGLCVLVSGPAFLSAD
jgi:hypothetical protein